MTNPARLLTLLLAAVVALLPRAASANDDPPPDKTLSPFFFVEDGDPAVDRLPLKDTRVEATISGVIADVTVRQTYENRGSRPIHARYVFPASTRAAVYGMTMTIGDKRIVAKIREREQAKQEFEKAKREGKSASLLEESRPNVFTMNVANVLPGDTIAVELQYTELLVPTDGAYDLVYPTVVGPRYSSKSAAKAGVRDRFVASSYLHEGELSKSEFHLSAKLSTGVPIQELVSPSHQVIARSTGVGRAEVALADAEKNSQNRDFILRYRLAGDQVTAGLLLYRGASENFFLAMAQPPRAVAPEDVPPREYVFVLDVSGSMNGFPLDTAKRLMRDLARGMRPVDTINVVVFADGSQTFAPVSVEATPANVAQAMRFIGPKEGGGGTELLAAMKTALRIPKRANTSRTVVLLTDGYIDAEKEVFGWLRDHLDQTNVFAFGIGSGVNRYLIEGVARAGQGEPFVVTGPEHSADAADRFRKYIESPVLTGISASFAGFDAYDVEPRKIPDLFASRPIVMFGKWRGAPTGTIELSGNSGRGAYHTSIAVGAAASADQNRALGYLWARSRIGNLSDFGAEDADAVAQVKSLGLAYNLLTPYTSFIAVEERVRRLTGAPTDVDQPLAMPLGVTDLAIGEPVTSGAEPELMWIAAALLALLGVAAVRRRTLAEAA